VTKGTSYGVFINSLLVPYFIMHNNWRGIWVTVGVGTLVLSIAAIFIFVRLNILHDNDTVADSSDPNQACQQSSHLGIGKKTIPPWIITFLNGLTTMPFQNYLSPYLREELGCSLEIASQVWKIIGIIGMVAGFIVGWLSDQIGIRYSLILTYFLVLLAAILVVFGSTHSTLIVAGACFALAFYPIFGLVPAYIAKTAEGFASTKIFGVANITLGVGGMLGNFLGGWSKTLTGTFMWIYVAIGLLAVLLSFLVFSLPIEGAKVGISTQDHA